MEISQRILPALAFRHGAQRWRGRRPKAAACVARDLEELLNFFAVPEALWPNVRTTNRERMRFRSPPAWN